MSDTVTIDTATVTSQEKNARIMAIYNEKIQEIKDARDAEIRNINEYYLSQVGSIMLEMRYNLNACDRSQ
jgi:hypothetical protein